MKKGKKGRVDGAPRERHEGGLWGDDRRWQGGVEGRWESARKWGSSDAKLEIGKREAVGFRGQRNVWPREVGWKLFSVWRHR